MPSILEKKCIEKGLKMTGQRRVIARVLSESHDHPDVELLHKRATAIDPHISIATVYRTVKLFEDAHIIERHDFGDGRARYEELTDEHHDHLIDLRTGRVLEFSNADLEAMKERVAREMGFRLVDHRLELFGIPLDEKIAKA
jgi:Fur family ferric uptake transcriptional regulator